MSKHKRLVTRLASVLCMLALGISGAAQAEPAKIASGSDGAFRAFGKFAKSWMTDMEKREARNRRAPTIEATGERSFATFTGYAPEWNVEVHPTGDRISPYVGVLHYEELLFTCRDETTRKCEVSRSTPVTEVFPYRDGAWKY